MQCQDIRMSLIGILCKSWIKVKVVKWCRKKVHKICECTCNGFEFHVSITIVAHAMYYFLSFVIKQGGNGEKKTLSSLGHRP